MLGTFVRMEKPMADNDDINDLCICSGAGKVTGGHRVVLFNNKYFRYVYIRVMMTWKSVFLGTYPNIGYVDKSIQDIFDVF